MERFLVQYHFVDHQKCNRPVWVLGWSISRVRVPLISVVVWPSITMAVESCLLNPDFFTGSCWYGTRNKELGSSSEKGLTSVATIFASNQSWWRNNGLGIISWIVCPFDIKISCMVKLVSVTPLKDFNSVYSFWFKIRVIGLPQLNPQSWIWFQIGMIESRVSWRQWTITCQVCVVITKIACIGIYRGAST